MLEFLIDVKGKKDSWGAARSSAGDAFTPELSVEGENWGERAWPFYSMSALVFQANEK